MRFDHNVLDQVRNANDIVEVISGYFPLKKAGRNFKALSPFKSEKTASFMVSPEKQIFHCFSTGIGGDVFGFIMNYEKVSFPEAVRMLAEKKGIPLPEKSFEGDSGKKSERESILEAYQLAAKYYHYLFAETKKGEAARKYFEKRGFSLELAQKFQIGWALDDWRGLLNFLTKKGFKEDVLIKARLINRSEKAGNCYDIFRGRLLFPIHNLQGKVVAFGGRVIKATDDDGPKYLNSPEHPGFVKRRELFGLYEAKRHIDREKPRVIVVEGYLDFLRLYEKGFKNAVATLGTALTEDHVRILKRFTEEVVVIYDGDTAGQSAALRGLEVFLEGGLAVKLISLPEGQDPDDFLTKNGAEAFQTLLDNAQDFFDYQLEIMLKRHDISDPVGIVKITDLCLQTLLKIENPVLLDFYIKKLTDRLRIDENSIRTEVKKMRDQKNKRSGGPANREIGKKPVKRLQVIPKEEILLLSLMIESEALRMEGFNRFTESSFASKSSRLLFRELVLMNEAGEKWPIPRLLSSIEDESFKQAIIAELSQGFEETDIRKAFDDGEKSLQKKVCVQKLEELQQAIKAAEKSGDHEQMTSYMVEYQNLLKQSKQM